MTENPDVNKELGAVDIVDKIDNNQRASAIDAIHLSSSCFFFF